MAFFLFFSLVSQCVRCYSPLRRRQCLYGMAREKRKKLKRHKSFSMSGQVFFLGCCCSVINHHMLYCRRCTHTSSSSSSWLYAEKWRLGIGGFYLNISFSLSLSLIRSLTHSLTRMSASLSLYTQRLSLVSSLHSEPPQRRRRRLSVCVCRRDMTGCEGTETRINTGRRRIEEEEEEARPCFVLVPFCCWSNVHRRGRGGGRGLSECRLL